MVSFLESLSLIVKLLLLSGRCGGFGWSDSLDGAGISSGGVDGSVDFGGGGRGDEVREIEHVLVDLLDVVVGVHIR